MVCRSDLQCDPGDSCVDGACQTPQALTGPGISVTPASASVETQAGVAPPPVHLRLASGDGRSHAYSVACAPDGTPSPASGKVTKKSPVSLSVQAGTPADVGVHTLTCTVSSPSAPSVQVPITVTATGIPPQGGPPPIGPGGGTVDLLDFVLTGDTRPPACGDTAGYPTAIHQQIVRAMAALHPQMALDLGDHMYVCAQNLAMAQQQMALYTEPLAGFPALVFMTMGNHECESTDC